MPEETLKDRLKKLTPEQRAELRDNLKDDDDDTSDVMGTLEALKKRIDALEGKGKGKKPTVSRPWWDIFPGGD